MMKLFTISILFFAAVAGANETVEINHLKPLYNTSDISGANKVFVYFWASWCPDCRDKLTSGALKNLQKDFPKIKILTVNADRDESRGKGFSESEKVNLPVYRDEEKTLTKALKLFAVPAWAILEKTQAGSWLVRKSSTGSDLNDIRSELGKVL